MRKAEEYDHNTATTMVNGHVSAKGGLTYTKKLIFLIN